MRITKKCNFQRYFGWLVHCIAMTTETTLIKFDQILGGVISRYYKVCSFHLIC